MFKLRSCSPFGKRPFNKTEGIRQRNGEEMRMCDASGADLDGGDVRCAMAEGKCKLACNTKPPSALVCLLSGELG